MGIAEFRKGLDQGAGLVRLTGSGGYRTSNGGRKETSMGSGRGGAGKPCRGPRVTGTAEKSEPFRPRRGATGPLGTNHPCPRQDRLFSLMRLPSWPGPSGSSASSSFIVLNNLSSTHLTCRICPVSRTCQILPTTWLESRALKSGFSPVLLLWKMPWPLP